MGLSSSGLHGWFPGIAAARAAGGDAARGEAIAAWGVFFLSRGTARKTGYQRQTQKDPLNLVLYGKLDNTVSPRTSIAAEVLLKERRLTEP